MTKCIVLCADDYGQAPAISSAIIALLTQGRLSATSCLVTSPYWAEHATWLKPYLQQADIGLHFNLTEGRPLSDQFRAQYGDTFFSLSQLMIRSTLRQLKIEPIKYELLAQIEHFQQHMGCLPAYLDGHQHVHQFPVVRDAVLQVYEQHLRVNRAYVRIVAPRWHLKHIFNDIKKMVISGMGGTEFKRLLDQHAIPHNTNFAGIYGFKGDYRQHFLQFLTELEGPGMVMCHPSVLSEKGEIAHAKARVEEYKYLSSPQFISDCEACKVEIGRLWKALNI